MIRLMAVDDLTEGHRYHCVSSEGVALVRLVKIGLPFLYVDVLKASSGVRFSVDEDGQLVRDGEVPMGFEDGKHYQLGVQDAKFLAYESEDCVREPVE